MMLKASWKSWLLQRVDGERAPLVIVSLLLLATAQIGAGQCPTQPMLLPTGVSISPAGMSIPVGNMPLNTIVSPDRQYLLLSLNGWDMQGIQVVRLATRAIVQTLPLASAFYGMSFSPDGKTLYVSGGNEDEIYRLPWESGRIAQLGAIKLGNKDPRNNPG